MKKLISLGMLCLGTFMFSQTDYSDKELLKNKRVSEFAQNEKTDKKNIVKFLKCLKTESNVKTLKELPFFTGKYPLIIDQRIEQHNEELWEAIILECKEKEIFILN